MFCCSQEKLESLTSSTEPHTESEETHTEPLAVIEQSEITATQPKANQAMKGKVMQYSCLLRV